MKHLAHSILLLLFISVPFSSIKPQDKINQTGENGLKQGHWIKRYPDGGIMYDARFTDGKPVGEFKRYDEEGNMVSVLNYNADTDTVSACIYHPNGYIAAEGKYFQQKKTGQWQYYSDYVKDHLLMKCFYMQNRIHGLSTKYHWNGETAEKLEYNRGIKSGMWKQYFNDGTLCLQASYNKGKLSGEFLSWHTNGIKEITGHYKNDIRTGNWHFFDKNGILRKEIKYINGVAQNRAELIKKETEYLDKLEKEGGKISDPEKTGIIR